MFKKQKQLQRRLIDIEEKMDKLMVYVPKLYSLLAHAKPAYPCEQYRKEVCAKCCNTSCVHHPETTVKNTADEIMRNFINLNMQ